MFGLWKKKNPEVLHHWYVLVPDFSSSVTEFYNAVEAELISKRVPGLDPIRLVLSEGELLSARREYLRMQRERVVFDICSAPFGTSWFFSWRIAEIPLKIRIWELLLLGGIFASLYAVYPLLMGFFWGTIAFVATIIAPFVLLDTFAASQTDDLDAILLKIPIVGALYEIFLRRHDTYYRQDAKIMNADTIEEVVRQKVKEFTVDEGINLIDFKTLSPLPYTSEQWSPDPPKSATSTEDPGATVAH